MCNVATVTRAILRKLPIVFFEWNILFMRQWMICIHKLPKCIPPHLLHLSYAHAWLSFHIMYFTLQICSHFSFFVFCSIRLPSPFTLFPFRHCAHNMLLELYLSLVRSPHLLSIGRCFSICVYAIVSYPFLLLRIFLLVFFGRAY